MQTKVSIYYFFITLFLFPSLDAYNAGAFPYAVHKGEIWFLLGEDPHRKNNWTDFGGKSDRADKDDTRFTAAREFAEETNNVFGHTQTMYKKLREEAGFGYRNKYRMYLVPVDYKDIPTIKRAQKNDFEKSDFIWVPAEILLDTVQRSQNDQNVFVNYGGKNIQIFHRFAWILREFDEEIRKQIGLRVHTPAKKHQVISSQGKKATATSRGQSYEVDSVSVLPFAFHQEKIFLLLGSEVRGANYNLMYSGFGTLVDDNAFIEGVFDPLITAGYGFQRTVRDAFGSDSAGYIRMAIKKTGKISYYDGLLKHLMCLAEIEYTFIDSANNPCRWFGAEDFLRWIRRTSFDINNFDDPVMYNTFEIYQPFAAVLKEAADDVERRINETKNKHLAEQQPARARTTIQPKPLQDASLQKSLMELNMKLNQLQNALRS